MIKTAKEVWEAQSNRADFDSACKCVMKCIEIASSQGRRDCIFDPAPAEQYSAVRAEFEKHGYRFEPYGYCGGVWQDVESICW